MSYRHSAKLAAIPPEVDQPQAEATDVGAGFKPALLLATQRPNQPVNYNFRHSLFRPNVEVIAVPMIVTSHGPAQFSLNRSAG